MLILIYGTKISGNSGIQVRKSDTVPPVQEIFYFKQSHFNPELAVTICRFSVMPSRLSP